MLWDTVAPWFESAHAMSDPAKELRLKMLTHRATFHGYACIVSQSNPLKVAGYHVTKQQCHHHNSLLMQHVSEQDLLGPDNLSLETQSKTRCSWCETFLDIGPPCCRTVGPCKLTENSVPAASNDICDFAKFMVYWCRLLTNYNPADFCSITHQSISANGYSPNIAEQTLSYLQLVIKNCQNICWIIGDGKSSSLLSRAWNSM